MARKLELTYFADRRCWKKKHQGKVYYVGPRGVNKGDRDAYEQALEEWAAIKKKLNQQDEADQRTATIARHKDLHTAVRLARGEDVPGVEVVHQGDEVMEKTLLQVAVRAAGLASNADFTIQHPAAAGLTIQQHVDSFLAFYRSMAKAGKCSVSQADALRYSLGIFTAWCEAPTTATTGDRPATDINASMVRAYSTHIIDQVSSGDIAPKTGSHHLTIFKQFVRHLWREEVINLPRNLSDAHFRITVPAQEIETYSKADISTIMKAASPRTRLYCLMALNTGATAKDLSDLHPSEVNWTEGTITRKRSKTRGHANVPTVTYPLWSQTLKLLKKYRAKEGDRVLLAENNTPLVKRELRPDNGMTRTDVVRLAFRRAIMKINREAEKAAKEAKQKPPAKLVAEFRKFRRTGATMISHHYDETLADLWMCHAPKGIAQRHYTKPDQDRLNDAVKWLGDELGIATG